MLERFRERASRPDASREEKGQAFILGTIVEDPQSSFRQCISFMLSHLDKCAANMRANLEKLNPDWLVAGFNQSDEDDGSTSSEQS